jgi:hypothetical protein
LVWGIEKKYFRKDEEYNLLISSRKLIIKNGKNYKKKGRSRKEN